MTQEVISPEEEVLRESLLKRGCLPTQWILYGVYSVDRVE